MEMLSPRHLNTYPEKYVRVKFICGESIDTGNYSNYKTNMLNRNMSPHSSVCVGQTLRCRDEIVDNTPTYAYGPPRPRLSIKLFEL